MSATKPSRGAEPLVAETVAALRAAASDGGFRVEPKTLRRAADVIAALDRRGRRALAQLASLEREVDRLHARIMALELRRDAALRSGEVPDRGGSVAEGGRREPSLFSP